MEPFVILLIIAATAAFFLMVIYNSLIKRRNGYKRAFAGIDAQLKRRFDLIPNLVDSVSKFMNHEKEVLNEITKLRTQSEGNVAAMSELDGKVTQALKGIMVAVENYPDLKSSQNFIQLQNSLSDIESNLSAARRNYNSAVTDYNNSIQIFPNNMIAGFLNFREADLFVIPNAERANVSVNKLFT
ncbi:LemA family protein [Oligoflexaceae bacterium]|nr:LemA family protein [Oligoflexaceae bacterium]